MTVRRGTLVSACLLSALVAGGCNVLREAAGTAPPSDVEVSVAPEEMQVRFPAAAAGAGQCGGAGSGGRTYAWTVRLDRDEPWHGLHVRAEVPASVPDPAGNLTNVLQYARVTVSRMEGSPPRPVAVVDSTSGSAFALGDSLLVVRLTERAAIRRVARGRALNAQLMGCTGSSGWTREVPVRYDPRF